MPGSSDSSSTPKTPRASRSVIDASLKPFTANFAALQAVWRVNGPTDAVHVVGAMLAGDPVAEGEATQLPAHPRTAAGHECRAPCFGAGSPGPGAR